VLLFFLGFVFVGCGVREVWGFLSFVVLCFVGVLRWFVCLMGLVRFMSLGFHRCA